MKNLSIAAAVFLGAVSVSSAKDWLGANNTHFVEVDNVGNSAYSETGFGSVGYKYSIGKYEVSNAQYAKFMSAVGSNTVNVNGTNVKLFGGFDASSSYSKFSLIEQNAAGNAFTAASGKENYAANFISAFGAAMYCNWLTNGASEAATINDLLTGAYDFNKFGASIDVFKEENINGDGTYRLPTADEWFKAAYYNPENDSYTLYAVGDTISADMANYNNRNGGTANVKQYEMYPSSYGTLNQTGNVIEYIMLVNETTGRIGTIGGGFYSSAYAVKSTASVVYLVPDNLAGRASGFRLAYSAPSIPEPSTYAMMFGLLALGFAAYRRRK